jgi:hypothetical protein
MVDLHGLYVDEALEYAKELQSALLKNNKVVRFIVGMPSQRGSYLLPGMRSSHQLALPRLAWWVPCVVAHIYWAGNIATQHLPPFVKGWCHGVPGSATGVRSVLAK